MSASKTSDVTYVLRHGRTDLSSRHIANGDPAAHVPLDRVGQSQCRALASAAAWIQGIRSTVMSDFPRARETADLLLARRPTCRVTDPRLNELDYGRFEGKPWMEYGSWLVASGSHAVPPGGSESRKDAMQRMLEALRDCLNLPAPRLVVAHGLLLSILMKLLAGHAITELILPEAPYVTPVVLRDQQVSSVVGQGLADLAAGSRIHSGCTSTCRYAVQVLPTSDLES